MHSHYFFKTIFFILPFSIFTLFAGSFWNPVESNLKRIQKTFIQDSVEMIVAITDSGLYVSKIGWKLNFSKLTDNNYYIVKHFSQIDSSSFIVVVESNSKMNNMIYICKYISNNPPYYSFTYLPCVKPLKDIQAIAPSCIKKDMFYFFAPPNTFYSFYREPASTAQFTYRTVYAKEPLFGTVSPFCSIFYCFRINSSSEILWTGGYNKISQPHGGLYYSYGLPPGDTVVPQIYYGGVLNAGIIDRKETTEQSNIFIYDSIGKVIISFKPAFSTFNRITPPDNPIVCFEILRSKFWLPYFGAKDSLLCASTHQKAYYYNLNQWVPINSNIPAECRTISCGTKFVGSDPFNFYAGTTDGFFRLEYHPNIDNEREKHRQKHFSLKSTKNSFSVDIPPEMLKDMCEVAVYDLTGRKLSMLNNHPVLNGSSLMVRYNKKTGYGVYIFTITSESFKINHKVLIDNYK